MDSFIKVKKGKIASLKIGEGSNTSKSSRTRFITTQGFKFLNKPNVKIEITDDGITLHRCSMNEGVKANARMSIDAWGDTEKGEFFVLDMLDSDDDKLFFDKIEV